MNTVYLNGNFIPADQAMVPVLDRGFLFGDGVYEVIPVFGGRCFRVAEHLDRLDYSLRETRIPQPLARAEWQAVFDRLIELFGGGDQAIYLQVTRGVCATREYKFPGDDCRPTVFAMSRAIPAPAEALPAAGAGITLEDIRWERCDIKSTSLLGGVLMTQQALDAGAREAILVHEGRVWEGASSNVFLVRGGVLYTAPKGRRILGGVTRDLIVELARQRGLECREEALPVAELGGVSELWISSSTREMVPITRLDGRPVGNGEIGPLFRQVWSWYRSFRQQVSR